MAEIRRSPVDTVGNLPHYLQGFLHLTWCRISEPSTVVLLVLVAVLAITTAATATTFDTCCSYCCCYFLCGSWWYIFPGTARKAASEISSSAG